MSDDKPIGESFVGHILTRKEDRGFMADLRHGWSETTEHRAWPHIAPWIDLTNDRMRTIAVTVAAGVALHKASTGGPNFGAVCRAIAMGGGRGKEGLSTFEGRFRRLLVCASSQELCEHLPAIIRAAHVRSVDVDFGQLFMDLQYWGERVRLRWAQAFWGSPDAGGKQVE